MVNTPIKAFRVCLRGTKPLLMHSTRIMSEGPKNARGGKIPPTDEAELGLYLNKEGQVILPGDVLLGAIKEASSDFKVPGKGKKTFKGYVDSGLEISDAIISPQEWTIDTRTAVIKGSRILRSRPKFEDWSAEFVITTLDPETWIDAFDKEYGGGANIKDILEAAGKFKGLCDYRPRFGRFEIAAFEVVA